MASYLYKIVAITALAAVIIAAGFYYQKKMEVVAEVEEEVHVHSDILVYIGDERLRFTDSKYQSGANQVLHKDFHFHDGEDDVIHRHADGLTLANFFSSLGFTLTNDCLTTDDERVLCTDVNGELMLFVNNARVTDIVSYIPQDSDRILIYYGNSADENLPSYLESVTDRACIYSLTCPERGTPPPESCGLTCEI